MQLKKNFIIFVFLNLFLISRVYAAADNQTLNNLLNTTHTMRANFTQKILDNYGRTVLTSQGTMALERPGKFRWEVVKPSKQLIIANAAKLWIYDPDLEQVVIRSLKGAAGSSPAFLLTQMNASLENDYIVTQMPNQKSDQQQWFMLKPKVSDDVFESIQIGFIQNQIKTMKLKDNLGHSTIIEFKNSQINSPLSASLFVFHAPAHVDIIHEENK